MNIILDKKALKEWEDRMVKMNEEYKKQYKVIYKKNGNFKYIKANTCKFCNNDALFLKLIYNYRNVGLLTRRYSDHIWKPINTTCERCNEKGIVFACHTSHVLSKNY